MPLAIRGSHIVQHVGPLLLIAVALGQATLARVAALTPWKGGGFGMFSTTDTPGARAVRVYLELDGRLTRAIVPPRFSTLASSIRSAPTASRLGRLADSLATLEWSRDGAELPKPVAPSVAPVSSRGSERSSIRVKAVRVEVWKYRFDHANSRLIGYRHAQVRRLVAEPLASTR